MPRIKISLTGPDGRIVKTVDLTQKGHFSTDFVSGDQKFTLTLDHVPYKIVDQVVQGLVKAARESGKLKQEAKGELSLSKSADTCTDTPQSKI